MKTVIVTQSIIRSTKCFVAEAQQPNGAQRITTVCALLLMHAYVGNTTPWNIVWFAGHSEDR
jgi:hypothetical protein